MLGGGARADLLCYVMLLCSAPTPAVGHPDPLATHIAESSYLRWYTQPQQYKGPNHDSGSLVQNTDSCAGVCNVLHIIPRLRAFACYAACTSRCLDDCDSVQAAAAHVAFAAEPTTAALCCASRRHRLPRPLSLMYSRVRLTRRPAAPAAPAAQAQAPQIPPPSAPPGRSLRTYTPQTHSLPA